MKLILPLLALVAGLAPAAGLAAPAPAQTVGASTTPAAVAQGNRRFALGLYRQIAREERGNIFLSPISIALAVAPLTAGAAGETRAEIGRALSFPVTGDALHPAMGALQRSLERDGEEATLSIANALWLNRDFTPHPAFLENAGGHYDAAVETLDFGGDAAGAAERINRWASEQTHGRIPHVVDPPMFSAATRLVVTNAVYFLADWLDPFPGGSGEAPFTLADGSTIEVPMMGHTSNYRHHRGDGFAALDLPYRDERLVMTVLLPDAPAGLAALERALTPATLDRVLGALDRSAPVPVSLRLPRLNLRTEYSLKEALGRMGMRRAFGDADFSGLSEQRPLAIDEIKHFTFLRVDEEGTEAAAVTVGGIIVSGGRIGPRPIPFHADHPFLFMLRDRESGTILFFGRIVRPE